MVAAIRSFTALLTSLPQESEIDNFVCLVGVVLNGLKIAMEGSCTGSIPIIIPIAYAESLIELAEDAGSFFEADLLAVFECLANLADKIAFERSLRHMLVEILVTLGVEHPKKCRKVKGPNGEKGYFAI